MVWVALSVVAAFLQNLRSSVQKQLTTRLSTRAAAATRFVFGLPVALLLLLVVTIVVDERLPGLTLPFAYFVLVGSLAQIGGTILLITSFSYRSFAVGSTYSKTEGIQTVLVGYVVLGDNISPVGFVGVLLTVLGVLAVSLARSAVGAMDTGIVNDDNGGSGSGGGGGGGGSGGGGGGGGGSGSGGGGGNNHQRSRGAVIGLSSGALFAFSAVGFRGAALALGDGSFVIRAMMTLVIALAIQTILMSLYLRVAEPGQLGRMVRHWRPGSMAGLTGALASAGWFTAFTLVNAAYVKAVGSIELIFAALTSWLIFHEKPTHGETAGIALVVLGVVVTVTVR